MKETLKYNSIIIMGFFSGVVFSTQFLQVPDDFTAPAEPEEKAEEKAEKLLAHPSWDLQSISLWMFPFPYWKYLWISMAARIITLHPHGDETL